MKKNKKKPSKVITIGAPVVAGILVVASAAFFGYNAYRYYTYPKMKSVHCYANNDEEKLDVYYIIIDGKISKKVEKYTYDYTAAKDQELVSNYDDSITHKYKGYAQKLWHGDNEIMTMKIYSFDDISKDDFKKLFGDEDMEKYLKGDKDTIQSHYNNNGFTCEWGE